MDDQLLNSMQVLFQKSHIEALISNQKQIYKWENYKKDIIDVQDRLKLFLRDLKVPVMIPIGNKALFRGKLVHTNDILISLGDSYFFKGSVDEALEIISRRIVKSDDILHKLAKEKKLLESKMTLPQDIGLFSTDDTKEIVEQYNDYEEDKWKEHHRMKVRDYKQKLSKMKEESPSSIKTDEDLWKHLDILEMEEELNDEIDRLEDDETNTDETDSEYSSESENDSDNITDNHMLEQTDLSVTPGASILKHSNMNHPINDAVINGCDNDFIKIEFKHSLVKPAVISEDKNVIDSPYDIYKKFPEGKNKSKKISKVVSFAETPEVKMFKSESDVIMVPEQQRPRTEEREAAFGDIIERTAPVEHKITATRPMSKFKSSRHKQSTL